MGLLKILTSSSSSDATSTRGTVLTGARRSRWSLPAGAGGRRDLMKAWFFFFFEGNLMKAWGAASVLPEQDDAMGAGASGPSLFSGWVACTLLLRELGPSPVGYIAAHFNQLEKRKFHLFCAANRPASAFRRLTPPGRGESSRVQRSKQSSLQPRRRNETSSPPGNAQPHSHGDIAIQRCCIAFAALALVLHRPRQTPARRYARSDP